MKQSISRRDILPEYSSYWHCSTAKKGYAGTAVFIRKDIQCNVGLSNESTSSTLVAKKKQSKLTSLWKKVEPTDDKVILEPTKCTKYLSYVFFWDNNIAICDSG